MMFEELCPDFTPDFILYQFVSSRGKENGLLDMLESSGRSMFVKQSSVLF